MSILSRDKANPISRNANFVFFCLFVVTLGFWRNGTDPVNIPKLMVLAGFSGLIFGNALTAKVITQNKLVFYGVVAFIFTLFIPVLFSGAPLVQQIYGVSGRNTGLLAYIFLSLIFFGAATFPKEVDHKVISRAILVVGSGSTLICISELLGTNIMNINNVFGAPVGTFGNPNFVSAFSAMMTVGAFALALGLHLRLQDRAIYFLLSLSSFFVVFKSKSFQGVGAALIGVFVVTAFFLYQKKLKVFFIGLICVGFVGASLISFGLFEKGPLASSVYQFTLPIRIQYWQAGISMLKSHPFTGIGLNSYGDWYRVSRDADALIVPGAGVNTNVAHNVYIDFASNGGFPLLLSFTFLFGLSMVYSIRALSKLKTFDSLFVATFATWLVYLIQAFFSIDQLGLSAWGWILGGCLIGLSKNILQKEKVSPEPSPKEAKASRTVKIEKNVTNALIPQFIFFWVFLAAVFPAFKADIDWANARKTEQALVLSNQLSAWPQDEIRYSNGIASFLKSNLVNEALPLTLQGLELFPRSSVIWGQLYQNPASTIEQKNLALEKMLELDPLNPTVLSLKKF